MSEALHTVQVLSIQWEATDVFSFRLKALDRPLPAFEPGSHIDVQIPNGLMRSYSLSDDGNSGHYRITVARDAGSSGGSAFLAEQLRPGATIQIGDPRNNFPLVEDAPISVFIAGGIGVTPFIPMATRLNALGCRWRLHYCVRTRDRAALLDELAALAGAGFGEIIMNYDHEPGGAILDIDGVVSDLGSEDHIYCCGPIAMLEAFRAACQTHGVQDERVHFEYFKSNVQTASAGGFDLVLAKTGKTVRVKDGQTVLEALISVGVDVPYSCEEGVCGACETRVLAGEPDHRDLILSNDERKSNKVMMVCCSGAKSASLTLDV